MRIIKEYNEFVYREQEKYFGKFMNKPVYCGETYFKWGDKKSFLDVTPDIRLIDLIRQILLIDKTLKIDNYRDFITYTLGSVYDKDIKNIKNNDTIILQKFDEYNEDNKSILNYLNTNILVKKYLLKLYNETNETSNTFYKKIWDDRNELFLEGGKYFSKIIELLNATVNKGKKIENKTIIETLDFFKYLLNDDTITITTGNLQEDMLKGIDLKIISKNNYVKTIQVKPLNVAKYRKYSMSEFNNRLDNIRNNDNTDSINRDTQVKLNDLHLDEIKVFELSTRSLTKQYYTDFIIFKDDNLNKYFVINNKDIIYDIRNHNYILANVNTEKKRYNDVEII